MHYFIIIYCLLWVSAGRFQLPYDPSRRALLAGDTLDQTYHTLPLVDPILALRSFESPSGSCNGGEPAVLSYVYQRVYPIDGESKYCYSADIPGLESTKSLLFGDETNYFAVDYDATFINFEPRNSSDCSVLCPSCQAIPTPAFPRSQCVSDATTYAVTLNVMNHLYGSSPGPEETIAKQWLIHSFQDDSAWLYHRFGGSKNYFPRVCALGDDSDDLLAFSGLDGGVVLSCLPEYDRVVTLVYSERNCLASSLQYVFVERPSTDRHCVEAGDVPGYPALEGEPYALHVEARHWEPDCSDDSFFDWGFTHKSCAEWTYGSYGFEMNETMSLFIVYFGVYDCLNAIPFQIQVIFSDGNVPCRPFHQLYHGRQNYEQWRNVKTLGEIDRDRLALVSNVDCSGDYQSTLDTLDWSRTSFLLTNEQHCLSAETEDRIPGMKTFSMQGSCWNGHIRFINYTTSTECMYDSEEHLTYHCIDGGSIYPDMAVLCVSLRCAGIKDHDPEVCHGRGTCIDTDLCECWTGFLGDDCEIRVDDILAIVLGSVFGTLGGVSFVAVVLFLIIAIVVRVNRKQSSLLRRISGQLGDVDLLLQESQANEDSYAKIVMNPDLFKIGFDELHLEEAIGAGGSNAVVYRASWNDETVAVKLFPLTQFEGGSEEFDRELTFLSSLSHPNILRFFGACLEKPRIGIVMEYCGAGDVKHYLSNHPDVELALKMRNLSCAPSPSHPRCNTSRPEKRECSPYEFPAMQTHGLWFAFFVFLHFLIRIFPGLSRSSGVSMTKAIGTSVYMSPEMVLGLEYSYPVDVFAFGIMIFEIITQDFHPYGEQHEFVEFQVANNPHFRPFVSKMHCKPFLQVLARRCWHADPSARPSFREIISTLESMKSEGRLLYVRKWEDNGDNAEDFHLTDLTLEGLRSSLSSTTLFTSSTSTSSNAITSVPIEECTLYHENANLELEEIRDDNDVLKLSNESMIVLKTLTEDRERRLLMEEIEMLERENEELRKRAEGGKRVVVVVGEEEEEDDEEEEEEEEEWEESDSEEEEEYSADDED